MRYLGGKARQAKRIASECVRRAQNGAAYYEPFLGGGAVASAVLSSGHFRRAELSDLHTDLILLWRAVLDGWIPPFEITRDEYDALLVAPPSAERGWAGFAASYNGMWQAGYGPKAESAGRDYLAESGRSMLRKAATMTAQQGVSVLHQGYQDIQPSAGDLVYLDPPYADTTGYRGVPDFDHKSFWRWANSLAERGVVVLVSEYTAPTDWVSVWASERSSTINPKKTRTRTEHLYVPV